MSTLPLATRLLGWIDRVVRRLVEPDDAVPDQGDSGSGPAPHGSTDGPPDHWIELVRHRAPELLEEPLGPRGRPEPVVPGPDTVTDRSSGRDGREAGRAGRAPGPARRSRSGERIERPRLTLTWPAPLSAPSSPPSPPRAPAAGGGPDRRAIGQPGTTGGGASLLGQRPPARPSRRLGPVIRMLAPRAHDGSPRPAPPSDVEIPTAPEPIPLVTPVARIRPAAGLPDRGGERRPPGRTEHDLGPGPTRPCTERACIERAWIGHASFESARDPATGGREPTTRSTVPAASALPDRRRPEPARPAERRATNQDDRYPPVGRRQGHDQLGPAAGDLRIESAVEPVRAAGTGFDAGAERERPDGPTPRWLPLPDPMPVVESTVGWSDRRRREHEEA